MGNENDPLSKDSDDRRETLHALLVIAGATGAMIAIAYAATAALAARDGWLYQATEAAAAHIMAQAAPTAFD
jgi:hypothetical protein